MAFIKEETEDMRISEPLRVKHEDTAEQEGWFSNVNFSINYRLLKLHDIEIDLIESEHMKNIDI